MPAPPPSPKALGVTSPISSTSRLGELAWWGFHFAYGMFYLCSLVGIVAFRDGGFTKKITQEEDEELAKAQAKYWTLSKSPLPGFRHDFFTTKDGLKLHYVVNANDEAVASGNIAIFIHGFPDSFLLWRKLLTSPNLQNHVLIAVDLPGYGGSDGLQKYNADGLLEPLTAFILEMRTQYLGEKGKVIMVTHDWGAILGTRLASEAKELADRWIIVSGIIPQHMRSNAQIHAASALQMLHTWIRQPLSISLLKNAFSTLSPIRGQFRRSFYIFIFQLPQPLANFYATMGNYWWLRTMHTAGAGLFGRDDKPTRSLKASEAADYAAMSSGPGRAQHASGSLKYPESVLRRTKDLGMSEKIRIYREGVGLGVWEKSLETVVALSELPTKKRSSGAGLFDDGPLGALNAPATFVMGSRDPAFERSMSLDGMVDYLTRDSQVLTVEGGHWLPHEEMGSKVIEDCVEWALGGEEQALKKHLREETNVSVKFLVEKR
ncbi:alpha/beta-hydrolase [Pleomassaria siparia CBS 279.74]|uniref:Alpha/beta-hydrolase n=1 Tax=Pleomassaria siparia CBS 279.74 TaxID=1314801 RepID=A0A6G1KJ18_9PLEO|nr:alpha/beta-hydrolase [Pleomassaria siparia CBS 279.74]